MNEPRIACPNCVELNSNFPFQITVLEKMEIELAIDRFKLHWKEKHRSSS
jgi:hypothetical protein